MKKILIGLIIFLTSLDIMAQQAGRVKISFAGFKCLRETADDFLHLDGKVDEVFLRFYFTLADQAGNTKLKYSNQTDLYGDNAGPFSNRINAGSAVDLFGNLRGGIKGGDNYSCNNIIGEYDLGAGDVLTVVPTIWEWDPGTGYEGAFDATIDGAYTVINQKASALSNQRFAGKGAFGAESLGLFLIDAGSFLSLKAFFNIVGELTPKPRPIGITKNGEYSPKAVLLNGNVMQQIASSNFGYGAGVIPIQYNEESLGNTRDHGNYIVLLKVDFTPKASAPAPPPPPSSSGTYNNAPPPPPPGAKSSIGNIRKASAPTTTTSAPPASGTASIVGNWVGTYGNGEVNNSNYYSFKLNADGTMVVLGPNGNTIASGNYTYSGNQLVGSYNYNNNGGLYSFAASMDGSNVLNGTWGSGSNVRGGGRWIMNKK